MCTVDSIYNVYMHTHKASQAGHLPHMYTWNVNEYTLIECVSDGNKAKADVYIYIYIHVDYELQTKRITKAQIKMREREKNKESWSNYYYYYY